MVGREKEDGRNGKEESDRMTMRLREVRATKTRRDH